LGEEKRGSGGGEGEGSDFGLYSGVEVYVVMLSLTYKVPLVLKIPFQARLSLIGKQLCNKCKESKETFKETNLFQIKSLVTARIGHSILGSI